jgi:hypothetical protein
VLLTIEGVRPAIRGCADDVHKEGFRALSEVITSLHNNGGAQTLSF